MGGYWAMNYWQLPCVASRMTARGYCCCCQRPITWVRYLSCRCCIGCYHRPLCVEQISDGGIDETDRY